MGKKINQKPSNDRKTGCIGEFGRWVADCATTIPQFDKPASDSARNRIKKVEVYGSSVRLFSDGVGDTHYKFTATSKVYHAFQPRNPGRIILEYDFVHCKEDGKFDEQAYAREKLMDIGQAAQASVKHYQSPLELSVEITSETDGSACLVVKSL